MLDFCWGNLLDKVSLILYQFIYYVIEKVKSARYATFDSAKVLIIVIFNITSKVRLCILHNLRIFWMSRITLQKFFSFWIFLLYEKWPLIFWLHLMTSQQILNHRLIREPLSVLQYWQFHLWKCLILILNN